jgi:hypothetical protein
MKFNKNMLVIVVIRQWAGYLSGISGFGSWQRHRFFSVPQYPHLEGPLSLSSVGTYKLLSITPSKEDAKVNAHTLRSGFLNLVCGAGIFSNFCLHAGNMFSTENGE